MSEAKPKFKLGIDTSLSSEEYHSIQGTYSSSQIKDALKNPEYFYKKYISKELERQSLPAFDVGTYFHTAVLEPHKIEEECAVYAGIRKGKDWEAFKEANVGKAIITDKEKVIAEMLVSAVHNSPVAMGRIKRGSPEISAFLRTLVVGSQIYATDYKMVLGKYGWEKVDFAPKNGTEIIIKARADLLADDFILDLKSTGGDVKDVHTMRAAISNYNYDLSAALYLDIFSLASGRTKSEFIWTFASKEFGGSKSYLASPDNILIGRAKWKKGVLNIAEGLETNWEFEDSLGVLEPNMWEYEYIKTRGEELL